MYILLEANSYTTEGSYDLTDEWDRPDTDKTWSFGGLSLGEKPDYNYLHLDDLVGFKPGDLAYVTVVVWSDGDSFGHDAGRNAEMFSAHRTREEAEAAIEKLKKSPHIVNKDADLTELGNGYRLNYAPWEGYFESLDYTKIIGGIIT